MNQKQFDLVMDYIDENIQSDTETIKRGIIDLIGINSNSFGQFFSVLTGDTLGAYIRSRRLYYAASELQCNTEKSIIDIALDYGYSDQSAFTRAFSTKFGFPPSNLRQKNKYHFLYNDKYKYDDFGSASQHSRSNFIIRQIERTGCLHGPNLDFLHAIDEGCKEFGFDVDTGYAIADLAERLELPPYYFMRVCFEAIIDIQSNSEYIPSNYMAAIDLGIRSDEDLEKICEYYACQYYELNSYMVKEFYASHS